MAINRRSFVTFGSAALGAGIGVGGSAAPASALARAAAAPQAGTLDATRFGLRPGAADDQGRALQAAIDEAVERGLPLFVPPGRYLVSGIVLPSGAYLTGVPGATQLLFAGGETMFYAHGARNVTLSGLTIAGAGNRFLAGTPGLVYLRSVAALAVEACTVADTDRSGIVLEYCSGHVAACDISGCGDTGLFSLDADGLEISGNHVHDCGNNGIQVWRSQAGEDATLITQNRIENIAAQAGGSGQNGNGIVIFRAGSVMAANNRIADCAYSAVRCNAGSNCQILGNSCARLGEVAIYAEFGFQGAIVANNVVDGAAMGVSITNFDQGGRLAVCTGNIIRNIARRKGVEEAQALGIGIGVEADTIVGNNLIEGAEHTGIAIGWGEALRDVSATGNVIRDAAIGMTVSVAPGAGTALVAENLISKTPKGAILGMRWSEIATGDLAQSGTDQFPHLRIERNYVS